MKNLKTILMVLAAFLVAGGAMASGNIRVNVVPGKTEMALVNITNAADSKFEIEVKNAKGDIVFFKRAKALTENYYKKYDFSKLENGAYIFAVTLGDKTEKSNLNVKEGSVQFVSQVKEIAPYFTLKGKRLELSFLNFALKDVKFMIYDNATNELLFKQKLDPAFTVHKAFDLSALDRGSYAAVLESSNNIYDYGIQLK